MAERHRESRNQNRLIACSARRKRFNLTHIVSVTILVPLWLELTAANYLYAQVTRSTINSLVQ
ncbi:MAG: hypothetical protein JWN13_1318 [Betaproteobacteria bacterium]|jgi:uncharacterized membrane protein YjdF|nr:hypothetical protein [Betaproteobacteria bacterium]